MRSTPRRPPPPTPPLDLLASYRAPSRCRSFQPIFKLTEDSVSQLSPTGGACQVQFSSSTFYSQSEMSTNLQIT